MVQRSRTASRLFDRRSLKVSFPVRWTITVGFIFEYVGLVYEVGVGADGISQVNLFGRLQSGEVAQGDMVTLSTTSGDNVEGTVITFMEGLYEWLALPFYIRLSTETMPEPFCLAVGIRSSLHDIACPGVVRATVA